MRKELMDFLEEGEISLFGENGVVRAGSKSVFKTKDAKAVYNKVLANVAKNFVFKGSEGLLQVFSFTDDPREIVKRQNYFKSVGSGLENDFLKGIKRPQASWKPKYQVVVVTEDDKTFSELKKLDCPVKFLVNDSDVQELGDYDVVQVYDCENYSRVLENLPQSVFLGSVDEAFLERYVIELSGWKEILQEIDGKIGSNGQEIIDKLKDLLKLASDGDEDRLNKDDVEKKIVEMNAVLSERMKSVSFSGDLLMNALSKGSLPQELQDLVKEVVRDSGLNNDFLIKKIPIELDEDEFAKALRDQELNSFGKGAEKIKERASDLMRVPELLEKLQREILIYDFEAGVSRWIGSDKAFPDLGDEFKMENCKNLFLKDAQGITFNLHARESCSILTGANSGGKTTLLEHVLQLISALQIGLPVSGKVQVPLFSEVYYFAKNKGSMSKGAFETLLTQMSQIKTGKKTLILADEIEAVTEPGVAGKMIAATADYFIQMNCYMIIATHLGLEIAKALPVRARIDGIEAKGLDANDELIVDHNPVLGRLAHSTPELIVEKMSRGGSNEYLRFLNDSLKGKFS